MALIIGLTGGIGAGKSTAAAFFRDQGIPVVDADAISRAITGPGARGSLAVAKLFGEDFLTPEGAMNRARMRDLVFRDASALERLEGCLHPLISEDIEAAFRAHADAPLVIYDCPMLERILHRPGMTPDTIRRMMAAQATRADILAFADDIIVNEEDEAALRTKLADLQAFWASL